MSMRRISSLFTAFPLAVATALLAGCSGTPSPSEAETAFAERLRAEVDDKATVKSFEKTDGLASVRDGVQTYELEYAATVNLPGVTPADDHYSGKVTFIRSEQGWRVATVDGESKARMAAQQQADADIATTVQAKLALNQLGTALEFYRLDNKRFPTMQQGLQALIEKPTTDPAPTYWKLDGYLKALPLDPWGNPFHYESSSTDGAIKLFTLGADNAPGGEGLNADIHLSDLGH